jgi:hypothetical protein
MFERAEITVSHGRTYSFGYGDPLARPSQEANSGLALRLSVGLPYPIQAECVECKAGAPQHSNRVASSLHPRIAWLFFKVMLERRSLGPISALLSVDLMANGFLAGFTERGGGVSRGKFARLNLGYRNGDKPERVLENRRRVCRGLQVEPFACPELVHGTRAVRIGSARAGAGFESPDGFVCGADALVTTRPRVAIAVMAADCLMVALADPLSGCIAVVHAGWRGLADGILSRVMADFDRPRHVFAAIGPAIGPDHYEVGPEVIAAVDRAAVGGTVVTRRSGRLYLDLPGTASRVLREAGVRRVEQAGLCTYCEPDRFYSYRRDGPGGWHGLVAQRL